MKYLIFLLIAAVLTIVGLSYTVNDLRRERDRYKANQTALLGQVEYYKTENGKNVASVQKLTLTVDELKDNYDFYKKTADELGIKLKRLQSVSQTHTQTEFKVVTEVRDTVIYKDSILVPITIFDWSDPWTDVTGLLDGATIDMNISSRDTLVQIVHRVPHKWWFFKWGTKAIRQEIVSSNPHTNITYSEFIELK